MNTYNCLARTYNKASQLANKLIIKYGPDSSEAKRATSLISQLDNKLKQIEAATARYHRPVGNYKCKL
jgi:hypothetical protein